MKVRMNISMFRKLLFSYVFIFVIPTIIMGMVMYNLSVVNLKREVEESGISKLRQVNNTINMRLKEMQHMAARISLDTRLAYYNVMEDGYKTSDVVEELEKYKLNSSFIEEILLYYRGDTRIYSSQGMHSIDTLTRYVYKYDNWTKEHFINDINSMQRVSVRPAERVNINAYDEGYFITYMCPTPQNSANPTGTLLFLIREEVLADLIKDVLGDFQGNALIVDNKDNILASKNTADRIDTRELADILQKNADTGIYNVNLGGRNYSFLNVTSDVTEWRTVSLIPTSQFMSRVTGMRNFILVIIAIVVLIGGLMTFFLSVNNYRPIKNLTEFVSNKLPQDAKTNRKDELEIIRNAVENVYDQQAKLESQIDIQKALVREQFLIRLLKGQIDDAGELENMKGCIQGIIGYESFTVMILAVDKATDVDKTVKLAMPRFLQHFKLEDMDAYGTPISFGAEDRYSEGYALLLGVISIGDTNCLKEAADKISAMMYSQFGFIPVIGAGKIYNSLLQLKYAYIEAFSALDNKAQSDGSSVYLYEQIDISQASWYPAKEQLRFLQSLKQGSQTVADEVLQSILKELGHGTIPKYMVKCVCYDLVNAVIKITNEICPERFGEDLRKLAEFNSVRELETYMHALTGKLCKYVEDSKESKNIDLKLGILEYIHMNFRSYEISLESVADHFNISHYYLSRFFKEQTGDNFSDYLVMLRMNEIKSLLAETGKPIKEIIEEVGYRDASNFARRFKSIEGVTPGEYRKLYKRSGNGY